MNRPSSSVTTPLPASSADAARLNRLLQRAEAYLASGLPAPAAACYESVLQRAPDHVGAALALAELHLLAGRHTPARALVLRALSGHLASPRLAIQLLQMLGELSESGLMIEVARQLPPPLWDSATSLAEVAQQLTLAGAHALARQFAEAAVARDPRHPPGLYLQATLALFHGDLSAAAEYAERCLAILPGDPGSHWLLSRLRLPGAETRVDRIERVLAQGPSGEDEAYLAYALHNELHDLGDYPRAWAALERACRAKRATLGYDPAATDRLFARLQEWTVEELMQADGCDDAQPVPIFVIGLHRSGTTLAERILGGHSQVAAGGETYDIRAQLRRASGLHYGGDLDPRLVQGRDRLDYRAIGAGYLRSMAWRAAGKPLVTDKLPTNYYNVGFIARALPRAKFIHLVRDPIDVGLSSLRTLFSHACPYSYDQLDYAAHYRNYRRLMAHWRALLPDRILDVDYEALVRRPEETAATMARFCGLDYEPGMLAVERRGDAVSTASSTMVRDGIRTDRGRVWKAYQTQLAPMIRALAEA